MKNINNTKIKFAISSHKNFYETTYPIIVNSLINSGVPKEDIYFFIGGFHSYEKRLDNNGINLYTTDHNSIDFTGLISVVDLNLEADYWYLLHDTCYVGNNFYNKVCSFDYKDVDVVKMYSDVSMNIGAYKQSYLESIKNYLFEFKNQNYSLESIHHYKSVCVEKEDIFFNNAKSRLVYNNNLCITEGPSDYYQNGTLRIIEYYSDMDLYKIKANWAVKSQYELNL